MEKKSVLITGPMLVPQAVALAAQMELRLVPTEPYASARVLADAAASESVAAIIVRQGNISAEVVNASPDLKVIAKHGVGYDSIDVESATRRGVPVLIASGANAQSVAEHALALMFSVARSTAWLDRRVREGHWDKADHVGWELSGKTLGVIGLGSIGRALVALVAPLGMRVLIYDPYLTEAPDLPGARTIDSVDEIIETSDVVSLHCPLTTSTRSLINADRLKRMRPNAILINTARGELVDEVALATALREGWIAGAGLDTFAQEPPPRDSELWSLPNLVATPHIGANTHEGRDRVGLMAVQLVLDVLAGRRPDPSTLVNPAVFEPAARGTG